MSNKFESRMATQLSDWLFQVLWLFLTNKRTLFQHRVVYSTLKFVYDICSIFKCDKKSLAFPGCSLCWTARKWQQNLKISLKVSVLPTPLFDVFTSLSLCCLFEAFKKVFFLKENSINGQSYWEQKFHRQQQHRQQQQKNNISNMLQLGTLTALTAKEMSTM